PEPHSGGRQTAGGLRTRRLHLRGTLRMKPTIETKIEISQFEYSERRRNGRWVKSGYQQCVVNARMFIGNIEVRPNYGPDAESTLVIRQTDQGWMIGAIAL